MYCSHCGHNVNVEVFKIENRGYGSYFDGDCFELAFCEECFLKLNIEKKWFDNESCYYYDETVSTIVCLHEENLLDLFSKLPTQSKEMIENCYNIHNEVAKAYN